MNGTIRFWNEAKFYGFVQSGARSIFFHGRSLTGAQDIRVGSAVRFEVAETARGPEAIHVEGLDVDQAAEAAGG